MVSGWSTPPPGQFIPRKDPVPIVWEVGWAPGPVWTGAENLVPTGIQSPDRPASSDSIYRLSYSGLFIVPYIYICEVKNNYERNPFFFFAAAPSPYLAKYGS